MGAEPFFCTQPQETCLYCTCDLAFMYESDFQNSWFQVMYLYIGGSKRALAPPPPTATIFSISCSFFGNFGKNSILPPSPNPGSAPALLLCKKCLIKVGYFSRCMHLVRFFTPQWWRGLVTLGTFPVYGPN